MDDLGTERVQSEFLRMLREDAKKQKMKTPWEKMQEDADKKAKEEQAQEKKE